eukprot:TRINITY_DN110832_c0_g1_i1.p1 TRINITY_DN110832_c0_g1~~TRINITY_DN110832_c0_g1_i1.p1  ORF type:complete len:513 (-),score=83.32 TRINITY_DN110832_c0_g1_i1:21-1559(-)
MFTVCSCQRMACTAAAALSVFQQLAASTEAATCVQPDDTEAGQTVSSSTLLQFASRLRTSAATKSDLPVDFFAGFAAAEGTLEEGEDLPYVENPSNHLFESAPLGPLDRPSGTVPEILKAEWFQESRSGGPEAAWQTYYPRLEDAGRAVVNTLSEAGPLTTQWENGHTIHLGKTHEDVREQLLYGRASPAYKGAAWFEPNVVLQDGYGRREQPSDLASRYFIDWEKRTKKITLQCKAKGCVADASEQLFDPDTELHEHCRLTIAMHATDFESDFSTEHLEWVSVNGLLVNAQCAPMASGCSEAALPVEQRKLYPCVTDLALSKAILLTGKLNISSKLNKMVDECPVDGNLLSGVASVTCFIQNKTEPAKLSSEELQLNASKPLVCSEPGCEASTVLRLSKNASNKTCRLTVTVNHTDFDDKASESLVFVSVNTANGTRFVAQNVTPGENPCHTALMQSVPLNRTTFKAVDNEDVSSSVQDGFLEVTAKLSEMVDECGRDGFLLDAEASVHCT